MNQEIIMFGDIVIENCKYSPLFQIPNQHNVHVHKVICNKVTFGEKGFKYSIRFKDEEKVKPLCIIIPKIKRYIKHFGDETVCMSF